MTALPLPEGEDERSVEVRVSLAAAPEKAAVCTVIVARRQSEISRELLSVAYEAYAKLDMSLYTEDSAAELKDAAVLGLSSHGLDAEAARGRVAC